MRFLRQFISARNFKFILLILLILPLIMPAQIPNNKAIDLYKFNYKWEVPLTATMFVGSYFGFDKLKHKDHLDLNTINNLRPDNVWFLDRCAVKQNPCFRLNAQDISDWGLNISIILPGILALDKKVRHEWLDLLFIYLETQALTNTLYSWGPTQWTRRIRPLVYYKEVSIEEKTGSGTTDSFYSGHVSNTATASFFMAKVYCDFHPELGKKKWILYGAAIIPPAFVGIMRYKALKHFPTDIFVGTLIGAGLGILIPKLHKIKKQKNISFLPMVGNFTGLRLSYQVKYK